MMMMAMVMTMAMMMMIMKMTMKMTMKMMMMSMQPIMHNLPCMNFTSTSLFSQANCNDVSYRKK
jgi:hypothetical protein